MDPNEMRPPQGKRVPPMMQHMMERMCCAEDLGPAAMCRGMESSAGKTADTTAYGPPEVRKLFEDWARHVEDEALAALKARGPLDLATLAAALGVSPEAALHFLGKLVREGKAAIGSIGAAGTS
jgi:hypothetical protein